MDNRSCYKQYEIPVAIATDMLQVGSRNTMECAYNSLPDYHGYIHSAWSLNDSLRIQH